MLVTLADMKTYLGITVSTYDVFLTQQITVISAAIEAYCNRVFNSTAYVQTFYKSDYYSSDKLVKEILCAQFPITAITSVKEKDLIGDAGTAITDYRAHKATAKFIKENNTSGNCAFFETGKILEISYTAGYTVIPSPVSQVVYNLVQEAYNKKINGIDLNFGQDVQSIAIPGVINIQYDFSLENNNREAAFGTILGSNVNILDFYRSERSVVGSGALIYV